MLLDMHMGKMLTSTQHYIHHHIDLVQARRGLGVNPLKSRGLISLRCFILGVSGFSLGQNAPELEPAFCLVSCAP